MGKRDINHELIVNKKLLFFARRVVYGRVVLNFFVILLQILLYVLFYVKLNSYVEYFFGGSILLSFGFVVYLINKKGKNEFKMAWMLPLIVFPLVGIAIYIGYHANRGGIRFRKALQKVKNETKGFIPDANYTQSVLEHSKQINDIEKYLINVGEFYPHKDNKVKFFPNGESFYPDIVEKIKNAKKFIFLEFFIIQIDESWAILLELLEEKVKEGVEVRVLYDAMGSIMVSSKSYLSSLHKKGIQAKIFLKLIPLFSTKLNSRDHRKIAIIDGEVAYTGGLNIANEYFNIGENRFSYWKDIAVRIEGPAIRTFTTLFLQNWNVDFKKKTQIEEYEKYINLDYKAYPNEKGIIIPFGDDAYNNFDIAESLYLYIINNAVSTLTITTPYVLLDNQLSSALIFAVQRGVKVTIVVPSVPDHLVTFCVGKIYIKDLLDAGVEIYLYQKGFIHAKQIIGDKQMAIIGSINLDYRSLFHHFECGVFMYKTSAVKEMDNDFQQILKDSVKMQVEDYKKIPKRHRFIGRIFRIFAPLM